VKLVWFREVAVHRVVRERETSGKEFVGEAGKRILVTRAVHTDTLAAWESD